MAKFEKYLVEFDDAESDNINEKLDRLYAKLEKTAKPIIDEIMVLEDSEEGLMDIIHEWAMQAIRKSK